VAILLFPFMPERATAMADALGIDSDTGRWRLDQLRDPDQSPRQLRKSDPLFPRLDADEAIDGTPNP
jgi:methionyl-tRNA synthetase